jgi:hypothetical protein
MFVPLNRPPSLHPPVTKEAPSSASTLYSNAIIQDLKKPGSSNSTLRILSNLPPIDPSSCLIAGLALSNIATTISDLSKSAELLPDGVNHRVILRLIKALLDEKYYHTAYIIATLLPDGDEKSREIVEACRRMGRTEEAFEAGKLIKSKKRYDICVFVNSVGEIIDDEYYWLRERIGVEDIIVYKKNKHLRSIAIEDIGDNDDIMELCDATLEGTRIVKGGVWIELLKGLREAHETALKGYIA